MDNNSFLVYSNALSIIEDKIKSLELVVEYINTNIKVLSMIDKENKDLYNKFIEKLKKSNKDYNDILKSMNKIKEDLDVNKK